MKIDLPNVTNARDLGGMTTRYGVIKNNRLIRSGVLNRLTDEDMKILAAHKLQRVIDLRTEIEMSNAPDVQMKGVEHIHNPIIKTVTFGISFESLDGPTMAERLQAGIERMRANNEDYYEHMKVVYRRYVYNDYCRNGYGAMLKLLANKPVEGATLWHCTMGKDRVGTSTALLEYCLGVSMDDIFADFMESNAQTRDNLNSVLNCARPYVDADKMELIENMMMVRPYYFEEFFDEMKERFGGIDGFLEACGVTSDVVEKLRKNYLE